MAAASAPHPRCVSVQAADFDLQAEPRELLRDCPSAGAVVSFVGTVRGASAGQALTAMTLEHYPGMTEAAIQSMVDEALERFDVLAARVVHRVGRLPPGAQIVGVWVAAMHRGPAFQACEFLIDYLKTHAPFWKKEHRADGDHWVESRAQDDAALARWRALPAPRSGSAP